jgi:P-type Ca2+ transporter type 2C
MRVGTSTTGPSGGLAEVARVERSSAAVEALGVREVLATFETSGAGLTQQEAAARLARHGPNALRVHERSALVKRLLAQVTHVMALLLWAGAAVALVAGLPELAVAIVLVNVVNGIFSFWQEHKAERAMEALRRLLPEEARVLRDGAEVRVPAEELVAGDVVLFGEGDRISADCRVIDHAELRVNQAALTGEPLPVRKSSDPVPHHAGHRAAISNLAFAGTTVASGHGKGVVVATAMSTEFGRIAGLTQTTAADPSPLQEELAHLSKVISVIAVGVGVAVGTVALAAGLMDVADGLVFALGMIVAFVPEGLLPTVTLSLAMGTQRMADRNALVKRLSAVETLGSTSVICTDKTGTLTQNEMTVREVVTPGASFEIDGVGYDPTGGVRQSSGAVASDGLAIEVLRTAGLACNARLVRDEGGWVVLGDPTEAAVEVACAKAGIDLEAENRAAPRTFELPFESQRKRMSTLHRTGQGAVLCVKGAPRELLSCCSRVLDGEERPLDDATRVAIEDAHDGLSRRGMRVLGVARRHFPTVPPDRSAGVLEDELTFLGLVGMLDPPRSEVAEAVRSCAGAGIRTIMITGDYGLTAESIARRVGLVRGEQLTIVNGDDLDAMGDDDLAAVLAGEVLFARASPEHKLRVVVALQRLGYVVAVTGDGVNDAPALKRADIGLAMGRSGTDVAREAADMVLLDDNFASIVRAVEEGRGVYANIRRFTSYIFTSNTPEAVPFLLFALSGGRIPLALGVMAILAIDLGTDLVPALALGAERPEADVMTRPPRPRSEHIVTRGMLARAYPWLGMIQSAAVMAMFFLAYWTSGYWGQFLDLPDEGPLYREAVAVALAAVVFTQIGNLFAQRSERLAITQVGLTGNRLVWIGIGSELVVLALVVYVPFLQGVIGTGPLPVEAWLWLLPLAPLLLGADELRKAVARRSLDASRCAMSGTGKRRSS